MAPPALKTCSAPATLLGEAPAVGGRGVKEVASTALVHGQSGPMPGGPREDTAGKPGKTWENLETTELALVEIVIIRLMID